MPAERGRGVLEAVRRVRRQRVSELSGRSGAGARRERQRVRFRFALPQVPRRRHRARPPAAGLGVHQAGGRRAQDQVGPEREGLRGGGGRQRCCLCMQNHDPFSFHEDYFTKRICGCDLNEAI